MKRTTKCICMLCAKEKPTPGFQRNILTLLDLSDKTLLEKLDCRTLMNIELMLSRKAFDAAELFSIGRGT